MHIQGCGIYIDVFDRVLDCDECSNDFCIGKIIFVVFLDKNKITMDYVFDFVRVDSVLYIVISYKIRCFHILRKNDL